MLTEYLGTLIPFFILVSGKESLNRNTSPNPSFILFLRPYYFPSLVSGNPPLPHPPSGKRDPPRMGAGQAALTDILQEGSYYPGMGPEQ